MANKNNPLSTEETNYTPYPSFEKAEAFLKYRTLADSKSEPKQRKNDKSSSKNGGKTSTNITASSKKNLSEKDILIKLAQEAKNEEKLESESYGRAPTIARRKLIDKFVTMYHRNIKLSEKQLRYTMNFLYWHPKEINSRYIKFLIPATTETLGYSEAIKMANELVDVLEDTKYEKPLRDYVNWLKEKSVIARIHELKNSGMNNAQIGEKLHVSSAQVAVLSDSSKKFIFPNDNVR